MRRLYNLTFSLFASLKLTVLILSGLAAGLFVGMFWDQTKTPQEHLEKLTNPWVQKLFMFLELGDVFHSWWFGMLVLLLALNLIACSIARLPKLWIDARNPPKKHVGKYMSTLLVKRIPAHIFSQKEECWSEGNSSYVFLQKHAYSRCGVYIIHTALLFIMFGSIFATQTGIDGIIAIPEGEARQLVTAKGPGGKSYSHRLGFLIKCDDFRLKTYTDGSPMEYESDLSIYAPDNLNTPIVSKTIRVNDPLEYQGYTFYQASYQALDGEKKANLRIGPHGGKLEPLTLALSHKGRGDITVTEFYEDYAGLGSAVQVQQGDTQFVVFRKYPDFDSKVRRGDFDIVFTGFDEPYATGVSVGKVPGLNVVFFGFILMFVGFYVCFGMNQRRYYAKITRLSDNDFELSLAGKSYRYPQAFEKEFDQIVNQHRSL